MSSRWSVNKLINIHAVLSSRDVGNPYITYRYTELSVNKLIYSLSSRWAAGWQTRLCRLRHVTGRNWVHCINYQYGQQQKMLKNTLLSTTVLLQICKLYELFRQFFILNLVHGNSFLVLNFDFISFIWIANAVWFEKRPSWKVILWIAISKSWITKPTLE